MFNFLKNWFTNDNEMRSPEDLKKDLSQTTHNRIEESKEKMLKSSDLDVSFNTAWNEMLDQEKKYTLRFLNDSLPDIPEGTLGLTGFSLIPREGFVTVALFIRNASSIPVEMGTLDLAIAVEGRLFAKGEFDLSPVGTIPPMSSRPWEITFPEELVTNRRSMDVRQWKLIIGLPHREFVWPNNLEIDPEMEKRLTDTQKDRLENMVHFLPFLSPGTVSFTGFDIGLKEDGRLVVAVLIRSSLENTFEPKALNVTVRNALTEKVIAQGIVDGSKISLKSGYSKPWILVFPPNVVKADKAFNKTNWELDVEVL
ncbi:SLAP domain-containing protein [Brevibacillus laterosporus]|uniref:SLAP domain-containing protein n=1 Tax=Brevibacillus laterosporus TaxID=1465 RepID=A0AAP3DDZ5_BRELA|nr:SLAP domain-containing protein [Brevibacillus laterosporus]MCR8978214.1 SLAP domain-containing protein [Brevibacillus laterosporus]MCZ0805370.1 SLAP domain-containing protein [Brevibacillus laterosporus]MCZ0824062.1 SLAP domain-containing protein [Brevibacillus laterosporus]MCZ0848964.1 SLAP domain-containing protein [Brevibacillus laterosporus]